MSVLCSRCGLTNDRDPHRYCSACHAAYQAAWRRKRTRDFRKGARTMASGAAAAGVIDWRPCQVCGSSESEMHHPDHEMPLFVFWLCRDHHLAWHEHWKATVLGMFAEWLHIAQGCEAVRAAEDGPGRFKRRKAA